jgi:hypothetical protein
MAKATKKTVTVKTTTVTLELSEKEAQALAEVIGNVGGDMNGQRGFADNIYEALQKEGFRLTSGEASPIKGSIWFK